MSLALALLLAAAARPATKPCTAEVVRADERATRALVAWLGDHGKEVGWGEDQEYLLEEPAVSGLSVLVVDVDNDGTSEHVLTSHQGSGGFLYAWVFRTAGTGYSLVKTPLDEPLQGGHDYYNPQTEQSELFVRFCGRTYVRFAVATGPHPAPLTYVVESGSARHACDTEWLKHERRTFQKLFERGRYDAAHGLLRGVQQSCATAADPELWLWMQSDLALTAHRLKAEATCREYVARAESSAAWTRGSEGVRKALATNGRLCAAARPSIPYDFSWLKTLVRDPADQFVLDPRFDGLLSAIVPDATLEGGTLLREALKLSLWLPEPIELVGERTLVLSGCEPHNCGNRGLVWIDLAEKKALVVTGGLVASTGFEAKSIPPAFWEKAGLPSGTRTVFIGPGGARQEIVTPRW
jgi:hypothetical protein